MTLCIKRFDGLQLVGWQQVAFGLIDTHLRGDRLRGVHVVASEHQGFNAQCMQLTDRFAAGFLDRIGHGKQRQRAGTVEQQHHGLALFLQRKQLLFQLRRAQAKLFDQTMVAQVIGLTVDLALHAATGQRFKVIHTEHGEVFIHSRIGNRQRHRVIGAPGQRGGDGRSAGVGGRVERQVIGLHRFAVGDRAGLIQRQIVELEAALQVHATLDQNAFARRCREAADDGHRGGDHQCARAGHHQQHQRAVDPVEPHRAHEQRRNDRHGQRQREHHRGVDFRELIDEALGRSARPLSLLDGMDDPRQGRVVRRRSHRVFQRTGLVDGAGEDFVAHGFLHRQAFAGDRRLIDGRTAADHFTVQCDALTGFYPHPGAEFDAFNLLFDPVAVGLLHRGLFRGHLHQAADGVARAIQRARLNQFGHGKQEHHHRRFRPLPDQHRTGHRDAHQRIDVEVTVLQGDPALFIGGQAAAENRHQRNDRHHPGRRGVGEVDHFGRERTDAGQRQRPPVFFYWCRGRGFDARLQRLGVHAQRGDRLGDRRGVAQIVGHAEHAVDQVELQLLHTGQFAEFVLDQRLLGRAVHRFDAEAAQAGVSAGFLAQLHQRRRSRCRRAARIFVRMNRCRCCGFRPAAGITAMFVLMHRLQFMAVAMIVPVAGLVGVLGIAHWSRP